MRIELSDHNLTMAAIVLAVFALTAGGVAAGQAIQLRQELDTDQAQIAALQKGSSSLGSLALATASNASYNADTSMRAAESAKEEATALAAVLQQLTTRVGAIELRDSRSGFDFVNASQIQAPTYCRFGQPAVWSGIGLGC